MGVAKSTAPKRSLKSGDGKEGEAEGVSEKHAGNMWAANGGALGNVVSQLHVHVIGRFTQDPAWPGPVWGQLAQNAYTQTQLTQQLDEVRRVLG